MNASVLLIKALSGGREGLGAPVRWPAADAAVTGHIANETRARRREIAAKPSSTSIVPTRRLPNRRA